MISFTTPEAGKPSVFYGERRYQQLRRVLLLMEVLQSFRFGADLEVLNQDTNEASGDTWHVRTTRRDLEFLIEAGLVDFLPEHDAYRWRGAVRFDRRAATVLNPVAVRTAEPCGPGQAGIRRAA